MSLVQHIDPSGVSTYLNGELASLGLSVRTNHAFEVLAPVLGTSSPNQSDAMPAGHILSAPEVEDTTRAPSPEQGTQAEETFRVDAAVRQLLRLPSPVPTRRSHFLPLVQWEGIVTAVSPDVFGSRLAPLSGSAPEQEAEIPLEEVDEHDRELVAVGAVFYWSIGYEVTPFGQRKRVSMIRFRRLPAWSSRDAERIRQRAQELAEIHGVAEQANTTSK